MRRINSLSTEGNDNPIGLTWEIEDSIAEFQLSRSCPSQSSFQKLYWLASRMVHEFQLDVPPFIISMGHLPKGQIAEFFRANELGSGCQFKFDSNFVEQAQQENMSCKLVQPMLYQLLLAVSHKTNPTLKMNFANPVFKAKAKALGVHVNDDGTASFGSGRFVQFYLSIIN